MTDPRTCWVCGEPVDPDDAHDDHEPGCGYPDVLCVCSWSAHPECCVSCNGYP